MSEEIPNDVLQFTMRPVLADIPKHYVKALNAEHDDIVNQHAMVTGRHGYIVGKNVFLSPGDSSNRRYYPLASVKFVSMAPLAPALMERHTEWWAKYNAYEREWKSANQATLSAIMRLRTWQDLRDAFPEHLAKTIECPEVASLQRTREDLFPGLPQSFASLDDYKIERAKRVDLWGETPVTLFERAAPIINTYMAYAFL